MKKIAITSSIITTILINILINNSLMARNNSYLLECRGGGRMYARVSVIYKNEVVINLLQHSRYAAGKRAPGPGECAWIDRPMSSREGHQLLYKNPQGHRLFSSVDFSSKGVKVSLNHEPMAGVITKIQTGQIFYLHVRTKAGMLEITKIGP